MKHTISHFLQHIPQKARDTNNIPQKARDTNNVQMKHTISHFLQHIPQKARDTNNVQIFRTEGNTNSPLCVGFAGSERGFRGVLLFLFATTTLFAQLSEQDVRQRLDLIHSGKIEQVRAEVSLLLKQYPNDPGVKYLDAYITDDGAQAVKKYQALVEIFPKSDWADDALYKVYQYYYAIGLYKTADAKLTQLNEQYPNSLYVKSTSASSEKISPPQVSQETATSGEIKSEPKKEIIEPTPAVPSPGQFVVQVGVFSQEATARRQAQQFSSTVGKQAIVFAKESGGRTVYAVAFDGFYDEQSARTFGAELKTKFNIDWFMVKR